MLARALQSGRRYNRDRLPQPAATALLFEGIELFSFLDAKAAKAFGTEMAHFYITRVPPDAVLKEKERQLATMSKQAMEKRSDQITVYKNQNRLNIYKVAQMGNAFKWTLKDAGYADAYIDKLTQWFIVSVKL